MIEVKNLSKTYHNKDGNVLALDNVSFKLGNKGIVFLFGASGEGKSTLSNVLSGLDMYDNGGKVLYNGKDIMEMSQKERDVYRSKEIGLIFEQDNLIETLSVKENITLAKEVSGEPATDDQVAEVLKKVKLNGYENRNIMELSSGEKQRVAIARMLLLNPNILFVDEPTGHLDEENSKLFWEVVKKQSEKCLVVAITHEKGIVDKYGDRVLEVKKGKIVKDAYLNKTIEAEDKKLFEKPVKTELVEKRANLSAKTTAKLGLKALKTGKFRLISLLVLTCFTLMTFALSYLLSSYNPSLIMAKSATLQNLTYVTFSNKDANKEITDEQLSSLYANKTGEYYKMYSTDLAVKFYTKTATPFAIGSIVEVSSMLTDGKNALGQEVLYGTYPSITDKTNKIVISDYLANLMKVNGLDIRDASAGQYEVFKDADVSRLIGKEFNIAGEYYEISAIYKTDYAKYVDENLNVLSGKEADFEYNLNNIYSVIHTATGNTQKFIKSATAKDNVNITFGASSLAQDISRTVNVKTFSESADYNIIGAKTTLSAYDCLLPISLFNEIYSAEITSANYTDDSTLTSAMANSSITLQSAYGVAVEYNVVGVTTQDNLVFANNVEDKVVDGYFGGIIKSVVYPTLKIATVFKDHNELANIIDIISSKGFVYSSQYSQDIANVSEIIGLLNVVFIVTTVFFAIFSMYFMFTFFASVIANNKKMVGALRTLGANTGNLIAVFMITCVLIMAISVVSGLVLSVAASAILNTVIMNAFALPISLLNMNFGMFGLVIALGVAISFVGSIIPISIYCSKTPVDVLKR